MEGSWKLLEEKNREWKTEGQKPGPAQFSLQLLWELCRKRSQKGGNPTPTAECKSMFKYSITQIFAFGLQKLLLTTHSKTSGGLSNFNEGEIRWGKKKQLQKLPPCEFPWSDKPYWPSKRRVQEPWRGWVEAACTWYKLKSTGLSAPSTGFIPVLHCCMTGFPSQTLLPSFTSQCQHSHLYICVTQVCPLC